MIRKFIKWIISPNETPVPDDVYFKLTELQERIEILEAESVENSNCFYEITNSIDAVDARIDILTLENWTKKDV